MQQLYPFAQQHIQAVTGKLLTTAQYTPVIFNDHLNRYVNCIPRATKLSVSEAQVQHIIKVLAYYRQNVGNVTFNDFDGDAKDLEHMLANIEFDNINDILSTHGLTM
jgi:hypothetical protein